MHIRTLVGTILVSATLALMPLTVLAAPVLRSGESVSVGEAQKVESDFYAVGGAVTVSGTVDGDLYAAAGTVTVNGTVGGDAVIAGGSVRLDGPVKDDVRMIGGELVIAGTIEGDVLVMGGAVHVLSTAHVGGDILFVGGEMTMEGELKGSLSGQAEKIRVNGRVFGDVSVTAASALELGDQAHVEGIVEYTSRNEIARAPGSVVIGDVVKKPMVDARAPISSYVLPLLVFFFTTAAYLLLFRKILDRLMRHTVGSFGLHGLLGFGVMAAVPIVVGALLVSIIGLPVGMALLLAYFLLIAVALSCSGILAGALFARFVDGTAAVSLKWTIVGTLSLVLLGYVPYLGALVFAVATVVLIGGITTLVYARVRS
ncbi:hypothetical protein HY416_01920 [Candidatus Kaiserbacteria bacterium]|nr:hypothetical protein [Candidatus Kaiserbacteria bacterium]